MEAGELRPPGGCPHLLSFAVYHQLYITRHSSPGAGDGAAQTVDFPAFLEKIVENRGEAVAMGEVLVLFWGRNFINGK